jgi:hypothetical protein
MQIQSSHLPTGSVFVIKVGSFSLAKNTQSRLVQNVVIEGSAANSIINFFLTDTKSTMKTRLVSYDSNFIPASTPFIKNAIYICVSAFLQ